MLVVIALCPLQLLLHTGGLQLQRERGNAEISEVENYTAAAAQLKENALL